MLFMMCTYSTGFVTARMGVVAVRRAAQVGVPHQERGQNRDPKKIEWSLYSVKKCLTDAIWSLEVSY